MTINTHDMVVVHRAFRREFALLPAIVAAVPTQDTARARLVAAHARELVTILHHHHQGEDDLLWPRLHERAPGKAALVGRMEAQHGQLAALLDDVGDRLPAWAAHPDAPNTAELRTVLAEVSSLLAEHLDEEERALLPVAAEYLSQQEWAELGRHGMAALPKARALVFLAHILEDASAQEAADFLAHVPPPIRVLYRLVGRRTHQRETARLRAGLDLSPARVAGRS